MSELRKDPFSHRWVVISKDRAARPDEFRISSVQRIAERCPFCIGNESETPAATLTYPTPVDSKGPPGWQVRVVPNRFPAVTPVNGTKNGEHNAPLRSFQKSVCGFGYHEVIIEAPNHVVSFSELTDQQASLTLFAYRERLARMRLDGRIRHVQVFKNVGAAGGASVEHTHSQLVALPMVPDELAQTLAITQEWSGKNANRCPYCQFLEEETAAATRIVQTSANFVAVCPFASRFPFETWILPRRHASHYEFSEDAQLMELAPFVKTLVRRIERVTGRSDYNFLLQSAPFDGTNLPHYHWHLAIFPRITVAAGFEWGTGIFINPIPPEEAAEKLRAALATP